MNAADNSAFTRQHLMAFHRLAATTVLAAAVCLQAVSAQAPSLRIVVIEGEGAGSSGASTAGASAGGGGGISGTTIGILGAAVGGGALAATKLAGISDGPTHSGTFSGQITLTFPGNSPQQSCSRVHTIKRNAANHAARRYDDRHGRK